MCNAGLSLCSKEFLISLKPDKAQWYVDTPALAAIAVFDCRRDRITDVVSSFQAIAHNQQIPHNHFRKDWQRRVRTHFDQAGKKHSRRVARQAKAAKVAPRPVDLLRPVVRCPTIKYNRKVRAGRGFTLAELKAAGIPRLYAPTIGIAVDGRRQNLSEESLAANVARLKAYKERLVVFPRRSNKPKQGDSKVDLASTETVKNISAVLPIEKVNAGFSEIAKSDVPKPAEGGAYRTLRLARAEARNQGKREKRARDAAEAEAAKK
ncbi:60s ribosomal protein l13 [Colletotrichum plurivorum]|uniref:60S ribosomal protein L13 n=1 Tax=Colletotrichum plurivorum TaxID=2175906 RepID=A0A8H6N2X1_9PEZI|nr:60s ribosomal protein l13 [Colletotrichum plurivorum]